MKTRVNSVGVKIVVTVFVVAAAVHHASRSHGNVRLDFLSRHFHILGKPRHFKHWLFVSARGDDVRVRLLLNPFDGRAFGADDQTDNTVRHPNLLGYLTRSVRARRAGGQSGRGRACPSHTPAGHAVVPPRSPYLAEVFSR